MTLRHGSGFIDYFMLIKNLIMVISCNSIISKTMQVVVPSRQRGKEVELYKPEAKTEWLEGDNQKTRLN